MSTVQKFGLENPYSNHLDRFWHKGGRDLVGATATPIAPANPPTSAPGHKRPLLVLGFPFKLLACIVDRGSQAGQ